MGLGTGGIYLEHTAEVFIEAYLSGYRLLDLAREYRNEYLVHEALLDDHAFRSSAAYRDHHQSAKQKIVIRKPPRRSEGEPVLVEVAEGGAVTLSQLQAQVVTHPSDARHSSSPVAPHCSATLTLDKRPMGASPSQRG